MMGSYLQRILFAKLNLFDLAKEICLIQIYRNHSFRLASSSQPQDAKTTLLLLKLEGIITHQSASNFYGNQNEYGSVEP